VKIFDCIIGKNSRTVRVSWKRGGNTFLWVNNASFGRKKIHEGEILRKPRGINGGKERESFGGLRPAALIGIILKEVNWEEYIHRMGGGKGGGLIRGYFNTSF